MGIYKRNLLYKKSEYLKMIISFIDETKNNLNIRQSSVCEFYESSRLNGYFEFLTPCRKLIETGISHQEAFKSTFDDWITDKPFKDMYIDEIFLQYPTIFGAGDITFQVDCLGYMEDTLKKMLEKVNEENKQRGKLYVYLGTLTGIIIVILLI